MVDPHNEKEISGYAQPILINIKHIFRKKSGKFATIFGTIQRNKIAIEIAIEIGIAIEIEFARIIAVSGKV
ncbi:MAG: hypothetical protein Q8R88_16805 [Desulfoprunum sp.]|nr:hypothetical protein [Desulfoprunum sp.]